MAAPIMHLWDDESEDDLTLCGLDHNEHFNCPVDDPPGSVWFENRTFKPCEKCYSILKMRNERS